MIKSRIFCKLLDSRIVPSICCFSSNSNIDKTKLSSNEFKSFNYNSNQYKRKHDFNKDDYKLLIKTGLMATIGSIGIFWFNKNKGLIVAKENVSENNFEEFGREIDGLKSYSSKEVAKHNHISKRIWCSYKSGVYDITDFIGQHPGGETILMAAGGALEPFWKLFAVHNTKQVLTTLENYRIGNLSLEDRETLKQSESDDPYGSNEPLRHSALKARSQKPFNAEPPVEILVESFLTPNDLFFIANHLPVPEIDVNSYTLEIEGFGLKSPKTLSLQEIKTKFPKHTITATIQCAGNRRSEMNQIKEVEGVEWGPAAISTAEWSGARLVDVLEYCGLDFNNENIKHVQFEGLDFDVSSMPYGASVEAKAALGSKSDFLIAYEMNGQEIPLDHGFPLRLIAPGIVGARNVKWLSRIVLSDEESHSHWQRKDYKSFSPNINWDNVDFENAPAIQELPVQSAICNPIDGQVVSIGGKKSVKLRGYAWSGGGRKIIRVDVSADNGKNWITADLQQEDTPLNRTYSWSLWQANIPISDKWKSGHKIELVCRAIDSSYNSQPENVENIWNLMGFVNNAWHRINITLK